MNENPVGKINCQRTQKVGQNRVKHCMMLQSHVKTSYRIAEDPNGRNMQQKTGEMQSSRSVEAEALKKCISKWYGYKNSFEDTVSLDFSAV